MNYINFYVIKKIHLHQEKKLSKLIRTRLLILFILINTVSEEKIRPLLVSSVWTLSLSPPASVCVKNEINCFSSWLCWNTSDVKLILVGATREGFILFIEAYVFSLSYPPLRSFVYHTRHRNGGEWNNYLVWQGVGPSLSYTFRKYFVQVSCRGIYVPQSV